VLAHSNKATGRNRERACMRSDPFVGENEAQCPRRAESCQSVCQKDIYPAH
jgi:hypothetical protein